MRHELCIALYDTGFSNLKYPSINQATHDTLSAHSKIFFTKPSSQKTKIRDQLDKGRVASQDHSNDPTTSDIKDFSGMYRDDDAAHADPWLPNAESQAMRASRVRFFDTCHGVILEPLSALAEKIGLEGDSLHPLMSEEKHFIACLLYPSTSA